MRGVLVVVVCWTACTKTQRVTVPLTDEVATTCVASCQALPAWQEFRCMERCPDAKVSDGECAVPASACVQRQVITGWLLVTAVAIVAVPFLAGFGVWALIGPDD